MVAMVLFSITLCSLSFPPSPPICIKASVQQRFELFVLPISKFHWILVLAKVASSPPLLSLDNTAITIDQEVGEFEYGFLQAALKPEGRD